MSEEPQGNCWEIDGDHVVPIMKRPKGFTSKAEPVPKEASPIWGIAALSIAAIASTVIFFYFGNLLLNNWHEYRETSARQELARIKSCINN